MGNTNPNIDIPEGFFTIEYGDAQIRCRSQASRKLYHQTKVTDSNNVAFACRIWRLRSTDIMQGVVFGTRIDEMGDDERLVTRFDFDQCFGTAVNRYCAQAVIGHPLSPFGKGHQRRGFLPLRDSMQCLTIALENPPKEGEYRYSTSSRRCMTSLSWRRKSSGWPARSPEIEIRNLENPRKK